MKLWLWLDVTEAADDGDSAGPAAALRRMAAQIEEGYSPRDGATACGLADEAGHEIGCGGYYREERVLARPEEIKVNDFCRNREIKP